MLALELCHRLVRTLASKKQTLSLAESCTGGMLSQWITDIPGASQVFLFGMVCYSNQSKTQLLHVPEQVIQTHGAVSEQTAYHMAYQARLLLQSSWSLSITGIAGPAGETKGKPIGMVCFGLSNEQYTLSTTRLFENQGRSYIRDQACRYALGWILEKLGEK